MVRFFLPLFLTTLAFVSKPFAAANQYIYRLDDVQDYWQSATQQSIIQWCMDNDMAISIGVIGGFFGNDAALVNKINECLALGPTKCEVFNHGLDATIRLGDGYSVQQVQDLIQDSHDII